MAWKSFSGTYNLYLEILAHLRDASPLLLAKMEKSRECRSHRPVSRIHCHTDWQCQETGLCVCVSVNRCWYLVVPLCLLSILFASSSSHCGIAQQPLFLHTVLHRNIPRNLRINTSLFKFYEIGSFLDSHRHGNVSHYPLMKKKLSGHNDPYRIH